MLCSAASPAERVLGAPRGRFKAMSTHSESTPAAGAGKTIVRVRYGETDCMGRVYHANYFSYFEVGRVELMRSWGFDYARIEKEDQCFLPVYKADARYLAPAFFDDEIEVLTRVVDYSFVRVTFEYEARRVADGTLCAQGRTVLAAVDVAGHPRRLPQHMRDFMETLPLPPEAVRRSRE